MRFHSQSLVLSLRQMDRPRSDPRLGRIHGGSFSRRIPGELDMLSTASPFFCNSGTHRAAFGERFSHKAKKTLALPRDPYPGPGAYKTATVFCKEFKPMRCRSAEFDRMRRKTKLRDSVDYYDITKSYLTREQRFPFSKDKVFKDLKITPGPPDYQPWCGYTSIL
jgi:hypothetical protein